MIDKRICPITYENLNIGEMYSLRGLHMLSPRLENLKLLPFTAEQQRIEARLRADKISIQGVQPKLSAKINITEGSFELTDIGGTYILKPQNDLYPELPENEDLTMRLAAGLIEVPLHGLLYCADGSFTYFIKRFDRATRGNKLAVEDFGQLAGHNRDTKYDYSMEKIVTIIDRYCTFPTIEKSKLFTRVLFNYLVGNEDMHLKNYSLITRDKIIQLAPAYDFLNTTLAIRNAKEQIALPINRKKNNLTANDLIEYYGRDKLGLSAVIVDDILRHLKQKIPTWYLLIEISFLSAESKQRYRNILDSRIQVLL
jgi:serine/threonine-protein kinase HipA